MIINKTSRPRLNTMFIPESQPGFIYSYLLNLNTKAK